MKRRRWLLLPMLVASLWFPEPVLSEPWVHSVTPTAGEVFYEANGGKGDAVVAGVKLDHVIESVDLPGDMLVEVAFSAATLGTSVSGNDKTFALRAGPLWALPSLWGVTPLVGAGFGMMYGNSNPDTKTSVNPYLSFGIGARYPLFSRFGLRLDADRFQTLDGSVANGYEVTLGVGYTFGGIRGKEGK